jgi:hypothetical protein
MAPTTEHPFRFLDLPPELRCCVYEAIEFPTTWHVLDRVQSHVNKRHWPVPPLEQVYDSRVTLITPHTPHAIDILVTCRLIYKESHKILKRKVENCMIQPVRYLVDWCAMSVLVMPWSHLRNSLGLVGVGHISWASKAVRAFLDTCALSFSRTRRTQEENSNGRRYVRTIEVTITHKTGAVYGKEVLDVLTVLSDLIYYSPTRLVVIYKSPLPRIRLCSRASGSVMLDMSEQEKFFLQFFQKEPEKSDRISMGVFARPLEEEAFEKHVEGLEYYEKSTKGDVNFVYTQSRCIRSSLTPRSRI